MHNAESTEIERKITQEVLIKEFKHILDLHSIFYSLNLKFIIKRRRYPVFTRQPAKYCDHASF